MNVTLFLHLPIISIVFTIGRQRIQLYYVNQHGLSLSCTYWAQPDYIFYESINK